MNRISIIICVLAAISISSCKKDEFNFLSQNHPDVQVTVSNLYGMFNGVPTVATSVSGGGAITVTLTIPENTGRTIKEITRVGVSTSTTNYKVVEVSTGLYNTAPINGNGTSVTFTTSLSEFTTKTGVAAPSPAGTATSFLSRYFYFLITLDNGDQIMPVPVRVYVNT
ncbi:MAG TPA: hypothetical protein VGQ09_06720 [Chitinophagaceae bacterium]|jgi:hypothetical protein|nr:hypothetical protein [Chitinophagaceae bacterium]